MATLRIEVDLPAEPTEADEKRIFVFTGRSAFPVHGNQGRTVNRTGEHLYNLNNPAIPASIAVSSFSPVTFDSSDLFNQAGLADQLANAIERGHVIVTLVGDDGDTPHTRAHLVAYTLSLTPTGVPEVTPP